MSEHVFPEIQFENGESCNICDSACKFVVWCQKFSPINING
jgi:hypothetical protein